VTGLVVYCNRFLMTRIEQRRLRLLRGLVDLANGEDWPDWLWPTGDSPTYDMDEARLGMQHHHWASLATTN
jgi:hypothetical protein